MDRPASFASGCLSAPQGPGLAFFGLGMYGDHMSNDDKRREARLLAVAKEAIRSAQRQDDSLDAFLESPDGQDLTTEEILALRDARFLGDDPPTHKTWLILLELHRKQQRGEPVGEELGVLEATDDGEIDFHRRH